MPSQRRVRLLFYIALAGVVTLLFFTSNLRQSQPADGRTIQDFYHKTVNALDKARGGSGGGPQIVLEDGKKITVSDLDNDGDIDKDDEELARKMAERLKAAEQQAKENANAKAPNKPDRPSDVIGVGSSAGGQGGSRKKGELGEEKKEKKETEEEHAVETELNTILKKSPVIIFSKSYCPYSKRAKGVLLDKYAIDPVPYVVELDQHPLGAQIQARLFDMTGRKTVPNIMVSGKSIGGSDEIAALDLEKTLAEKIKSLGGTRVKVTERLSDDTQKPL